MRLRRSKDKLAQETLLKVRYHQMTLQAIVSAYEEVQDNNSGNKITFGSEIIWEFENQYY